MTTDTDVSTRPMARTGKVFAAIAIVEAATWAGLLVGMFLKYVTETTELGVRIFGMLHGIAFIAYLIITIATAVGLRWSRRVTIIAVLAAIPPLVTLPLELWLRRTGRLTVDDTPSR
ncbi:DUF3817 domain-containing protein [Amycolatopsis pittospori]|uniref:DUF3817 domain-containing protein n=1 Tax=Amycolatopsis pittospori TaxID=2749434 RepID=UPI0015F0AA6E|nr:DUF3817 domain-containing protein [Amycolatopsis pittospori]